MFERILKGEKKKQERKTDTYSKLNALVITVLITFKIWAFPSILENNAKIRFIDNVYHRPCKFDAFLSCLCELSLTYIMLDTVH